MDNRFRSLNFPMANSIRLLISHVKERYVNDVAGCLRINEPSAMRMAVLMRLRGRVTAYFR